MKPDDKICYCYHVSLRKLVHYARRERPAKASQMSNCLGAGTGCGWCIPILTKIHQRFASSEGADDSAFSEIQDLPTTAEAYAEARQAYLKSPEKNRF